MDFKENQEFEKFFIMFLNGIKEIDNKNKYCQKYLENQKNLKYNKYVNNFYLYNFNIGCTIIELKKEV